jgi:hypothetical protein
MPLTKFIDDSYYIAGNTSLLVSNTNLLIKGGAFGYGVAITGAAAFDALTAPTITSKCFFGVGCLCEAAGTITTGLSLFNSTVGLPPVGMVCESASVAFFWLGRRSNQAAAIL